MNVKTMVGWVLSGGIALLMAPAGWANSIEVKNVSLQKYEEGAQRVNVQFDLSWSNSWRGTDNRDAAWVFVKFRAPGSNIWQHAELSRLSSDHTPVLNSTIDAVSDGKGVFVYRSGNYTGIVSYTGMKLKWTYGSNGYAFAKGDLIDVSVHAIEMVYIPEGAFYLGSGGTENYHFYRYSDGLQSTNPYLVSSEAVIPVGSGDGNLYYAAGGGDQIGTLSNAFPKGYNAFYCMKYEISQGQYVDFLNKLTATQDGNRFPNQNGNKRHTITGTTTNRSASAPDRGCNYLAWEDGAAYLDWAALRPMTELEFEKASRGSAAPFPGEYAWGTNLLIQLATESGTPGSGSETPGGASDNCLYGGALDGPTRVGIFARATSDRVKAGAGYFGVMELSGNLWERIVTVGHPIGRIFQGTLGDGLLSTDGKATNPDWPLNSNGNGSGLRGGSWFNTAACEQTSDRGGAAAPNAGRDAHFGSRGVRQAP
jgi:formylglycine-generating enzyme required for sulfatase activity